MYEDYFPVELPLLSEIVGNEFKVPTGYSINQLTPGLLHNLGSANSDLRENSLDTLWTWIVENKYSNQQVVEIGSQTAANLHVGLGDSCSDSVFLRAFSALILGAVVNVNRIRSLQGSERIVSDTQIKDWLNGTLLLLAEEKDLRGYVEEKGWAHCAAHTGDLLSELVSHPALDEGDLELVLNTLSDTLMSAVDHVFIHNEDERLAAIVIKVLQRDLLPLSFYERWVNSFIVPRGISSWKDAFTQEFWNNARVNSKAFLRSLYFFIVFGFQEDGIVKPIEYKEPLSQLILQTLKQIYPNSRYGDEH